MIRDSAGLESNSMDDVLYENVKNPTDLSVEAALELEELKQGIRSDAPALTALFHYIRTPAPAFEGQSVSMLDDIRAYALLRDSLDGPKKTRAASFPEFRQLIERYLTDLERGVANNQQQEIDEAKRFCLSLNSQMVAKQMNELYSRRERADARNFDHESLP
jgi:hypothetical protein